MIHDEDNLTTLNFIQRWLVDWDWGPWLRFQCWRTENYATFKLWLCEKHDRHRFVDDIIGPGSYCEICGMPKDDYISKL